MYVPVRCLWAHLPPSPPPRVGVVACYSALCVMQRLCDDSQSTLRSVNTGLWERLRGACLCISCLVNPVFSSDLFMFRSCHLGFTSPGLRLNIVSCL